MPAYNSQGPVTALAPGDSAYAFNNESISAGTASQQFALASPYDGEPPSLSVEGAFSGAPGTFSLQVQTADTDSANSYVTLPSTGTINAVGGNNQFRAELAAIKAKFIRLLLASLTNSVALTANISR